MTSETALQGAKATQPPTANDAPLRVLHLSASYWPFFGGAERAIQGISERLAADGHAVTVLCSDARVAESYWLPGRARVAAASECHNGVTIRRVPVAHLLGWAQSFPWLRRAAMLLSMLPGTLPIQRRLGRVLPWLPALETTLGSLGPVELVHGFNIALEAPMLAAWRWARQHGLPFVATPFLHVGEPGSRFVERHYTMGHQLEMLRDADHLFTMTDIEARRLAELGVPPDRIERLGVGVEPPTLPAGAAARFRSEHDIRGALVAFVGSITRDKGAIHLVEACRRLWEEGGELTLALAGTPVTEFHDFWATVPAEARARTRLLGALPEADKWALLAACDLLAMPSRVDSFGIVYLEAWTQRKPVIGARAGGVPDVVTDGEEGLLVPYGDVPALAQAIAALLNDPARRAAMGERGHHKAHHRYAWPTLYGQVRAAYQRLAARG